MFSFLETTSLRPHISVELQNQNLESEANVPDIYATCREILQIILDFPRKYSKITCFEKINALLEVFGEADARWIVNYTDKKSFMTSLLLAAELGIEAVVALLLDHGADINVCNDVGCTAVYFASLGGHFPTVNILINRGASILRANIINWSPIFAASSEGHHQIVKLLIVSGADVNLFDKDKITPISLAVKNKHIDTVSVLLKAGAALDNAASHGVSPLLVACYYGFIDIARLLIDGGAKVNAVDKDGFSSIFFAAQQNFLDVVEMLLSVGANIEVRNKLKQSPLYAACMNNNVDIARVLLAAGADANGCFGEDNCTLLMSACNLGLLEIVRLLVTEVNVDINFVQNETLWSALHAATLRNHAVVVRFLVDRGVHVNVRTAEGWSPLYVACTHGCIAAAKELLRSPEIQLELESSESNFTPLFIACCNGHAACVRLLLEAGADPLRKSKVVLMPNVVFRVVSGFQKKSVACKCTECTNLRFRVMQCYTLRA
jgi:ankyrin repeat protein